jgi:hypothetical protein
VGQKAEGGMKLLRFSVCLQSGICEMLPSLSRGRGPMKSVKKDGSHWCSFRGCKNPTTSVIINGAELYFTSSIPRRPELMWILTSNPLKRHRDFRYIEGDKVQYMGIVPSIPAECVPPDPVGHLPKSPISSFTTCPG